MLVLKQNFMAETMQLFRMLSLVEVRMKPHSEWPTRLGALATAALTCALCTGGVAAQVVHVGYNPALEAYVPMVDTLLRRAGLQPDFYPYPLERLSRMLEHGEIDIDMARRPEELKGKEYPFRLVGPLICSRLVVFVRAEEGVPPFVPGKFTGPQIGILLGSRGSEQATASFGDGVIKVSDAGRLLKMLDAKRLDAVVLNEGVGLAELVASGFTRSIRTAEPALDTVQGHLVLRTHLDEWGPRIEAAFAAEQASGHWKLMANQLKAKRGLPPATQVICERPAVKH